MVEDEPLLRLAAIDIVEEAGFEALDAADADQAIAILETRPDIHIVFSDIQMPGDMDGLKLAAYIRNRWLPIVLILTSGYVAPYELNLPEGGLFFAKPYRQNEVAEAFRRAAA